MHKHTKKALVLSVLSLMLCVSMLVGTTFAWFTDSVTTGVNTIQSGTLDVDMVKPDGSAIGDKLYFRNVKGSSDILWEPGAKFALDAFKIVNKGNLALKYQVLINGLEGDAKLLEVIDFTVQVGTNQEIPLAEFNAMYGEGLDNYLLAKTETEAITIYGKMREEANNDYQNKTIEGISITVYATQYTYENDSFDNQYDADAPVVTYKVNPNNVQDYLDGKYGSTTNMKLVLEAGTYSTLYLGRPTKYAGSNTTYICGDGNTHSKNVFETTDAEEFKAHLADNKWHTTPKYVTTIDNLTIVGEDGAKVAGLVFSTGHSYGDVYDYVRDIDYDAGSAYYSTAYVSNVTIENVAFTGKTDINTSDATTVVDGVTFRNCSFTTDGTAAANGAAIRYYNEANNGNVKNITVENCKFTNCYQGVYTQNIKGITVTGNTFNTTGHNAVAVQGAGVNHGAVVISNNVFTNIGDRVIRFNEIGADTQITIQYNAAVNSGDSDGEVIKATSIADGATFDVKYNDWGAGKVVVNDQLKDAANTKATYAANNTGLNDALTSGADTIILGSGDYIVPDSAQGKTLTIVGNGETVVAAQDDGAAEGDCDYCFDGSTVTFENVTITTSATYFPGYARMKGIYNNCTINGVWTLYDNSEFNNCTFNVSGDLYNVWTWGASVATFNGCTFNNDGKAILLYGQANTKLTINGCTFNDNGDDTVTGKAAIEIGNDYNKSYELIVNDATVNGYAINTSGIITGTTLWANKNSMGTDKLNVVVDGVDVY